jgi:hypothetical protein
MDIQLFGCLHDHPPKANVALLSAQKNAKGPGSHFSLFPALEGVSSVGDISADLDGSRKNAAERLRSSSGGATGLNGPFGYRNATGVFTSRTPLSKFGNPGIYGASLLRVGHGVIFALQETPEPHRPP